MTNNSITTEAEKNSKTESNSAKRAEISSQEPNYMLSKKDLLFIVVFSIVTGIVLNFSFPLLSLSNEGDETLKAMRYMSLLIFILLIVGLWKGYRTLKTIAIENGIVTHILSDIKGRSATIANGTIAPPNFDDLSRIIPFPSIKKEPVCRKMMVRILRDGADYIYDQRETVVRPYKEELSDRLFLLSSLQTTALRLGILGTFIGLIIALINLGGIPDIFEAANGTLSNGMLARRELFVKFSENLFSALHVAFGTSVAGLEVAILLTFLNMYLKSSQKVLFRKMDESAGEMMSLARRATYKEKGLLSSFAQMKSSIESIELKIHHENQTTVRSVEALGNKLVEQTKLIDKGMSLVSETQRNWQAFLSDLKIQQKEVFEETVQQRSKVEESYKGFLDQLDEREKIFIKDLSKALDLLSIDKLGKGILGSVEQTGRKLEKSINSYTLQIASKLVSAGKDLRGVVSSDIIELSNHVESACKSQEMLSNILISTIENIQTLSKQVENSKKSATTFDRFQKNLAATLQRVEDAQISFQKDIQESVERLQSIPLDQRFEDRIVIAANKSISPLNQTLKQVSSKIETLNKTGSTIRKGVYYLDRIFSNRIFKFGYKVAIILSIVTGISLVAMATLGIVTSFTGS